MKKFISNQKIMISLCLCIVMAFTIMSFKDSTIVAQRTQQKLDTLPKKSDIELELKLEDVESIIKMSLDIAAQTLKELNIEKITTEVEQSLKNIDVEKIKLEIDASLKNINWDKIESEINNSLKEIDTKSLKVTIEKAMKDAKTTINSKEMRRNLEELKKINTDDLKKEIEKLKKEMQLNKEKMKLDIEKARQELQKANAEMKNTTNRGYGMDKDRFFYLI